MSNQLSKDTIEYLKKSGFSDDELKLVEKFKFVDNGIEPLPIQRLKWVEKLYPDTKSVMNNLKNICVGENYLDKLTTMEITEFALRESYSKYAKEFANDKLIQNNYTSFIVSTVYNLTYLYNWNLYRQVYRFDKDTLELLLKADINEIPFDIIKDNLPYPAFFIDNRFISKYTNVLFKGCFVSLLNIENRLELGLFFVEDTAESDYRYIFLPLYMGNKTVEDCISERNKEWNVPNTNEDDTNIVFDLCKQVLKAIIYMCSVNKEVETVKVTVSNNNAKKKKKSKKPKTVNQNYVGYKMGNIIRKNKKSYVYVDEEGNLISKNKGSNSKKSPHLRMGHYHHFWTGRKDKPEERKLILKYVPPIYIHSNDIKDTTLHKVK